MSYRCLYRCQYSDVRSGWINAKPVFIDCYESSVTYLKIINKSQYNYWTISGLLFLLDLQIRLIKEENEDISVEKEEIQKVRHD